MKISCDSEFGDLEAVAVASPGAYRQTAPINVRQVHEYERAAIDVERLGAEHRGVVDALRARGMRVVEIPPHPDLPYLLNVRDACVAIGTHLVACRMGRSVRRPEPYWVSAHLGPPEEIGLRTIARGRLEGGDLFQFGSHLVVGLGSRTSAAGVATLRRVVPTVKTVSRIELLPDVLHLDTVFNVIGRTALVARALLRSPGELDEALKRLDVDDLIELTVLQAQQFATNFLALGPRAVLGSTSCSDVSALLSTRGIEVHAVPMHEHERIGGSVRCMTLPLRRVPMEQPSSAREP